MGESNHIPGVNSSNKPELQKLAKQQAKQQQIVRMQARQIGSKGNIQEAAETMIYNPMAQKKKSELLKNRVATPTPENASSKKSEDSKPAESKNLLSLENTAKAYQKNNPELNSKTLVNLLKELNPEDSHEQVLKILETIYKDEALIDEAIDFLIEVSDTKEGVKQKYINIKQEYNAQFGREIQAGRNISQEARTFSEKGLGSPTALRDLYREITGNPRSPHQLFDELSENFQFSDMKNIIDFILHSLGKDLKSKGPSIPKGELKRLMDEGRSMQAILGVFRFFFGRMSLIEKEFDHYDLSMPSRMKFDLLAQLLMKLLEDRYPNSDKILSQSVPMGISDELAAQIIVFNQYRDAMRHISPKLFKSERHRQELLLALMEMLSDLEDELIEEEEE